MTYPAQPPYPPQGQPQPGYAPAPGYAPQPQYAPQPAYQQQPAYQPPPPGYAPQPQQQFAPAGPAPVPVRATLDEFSDQPTGGGGAAVTKFFKGRPQGSWLQLRITRNLNSSDITHQQNDGVLQYYKTNGVPDPTKPKFVMIIKTEVVASSDPAGANVAFPDGAAAIWLKGVTKDALVASIGAAGLPDPDTIFRKGKLGGAIVTMISAGEKPSSNPMFAATKLYNFQYQPGGNEMSAFQQTDPTAGVATPSSLPPAPAPAASPQYAPEPQQLQQLPPPPADPGPAQYAPQPTAPVQPQQAPPQQYQQASPLPPAPPVPSNTPSAPPAPPQGYAPVPPPPGPAGYAPPPTAPVPNGYAPAPPQLTQAPPMDPEKAATLARLNGGQG